MDICESQKHLNGTERVYKVKISFSSSPIILSSFSPKLSTSAYTYPFIRNVKCISIYNRHFYFLFFLIYTEDNWHFVLTVKRSQLQRGWGWAAWNPSSLRALSLPTATFAHPFLGVSFCHTHPTPSEQVPRRELNHRIALQ